MLVIHYHLTMPIFERLPGFFWVKLLHRSHYHDRLHQKQKFYSNTEHTDHWTTLPAERLFLFPSALPVKTALGNQFNAQSMCLSNPAQRNGSTTAPSRLWSSLISWFFLRIQLWKSGFISICWQGEHSLGAGMPGEFHQLRDICSITHRADVSPSRARGRKIHQQPVKLF